MSEITNKRREAMGWEQYGCLWVHKGIGGDLRFSHLEVSRILLIQEENARLKDELAELRKAEAPNEWAPGQVWENLDRVRAGVPGRFVVLDTREEGLYTLLVDDAGRMRGSAHAQPSLGRAQPAPSEYFEYIGQYNDLYGVDS